MLLETLDVKKNDVIIFSQNIFDLENNFKIIFKDDPDKKIRKISFTDVSKFVNEYTPKNLIVYRLLTNIKNFELKLTNYGSFVSLNGSMELIYLDPVYAVKELEDYKGNIEKDLRFRIQQIGLTTISRINNSANFSELYSIDLLAEEAKNQNDRVFVDVIFAKDRSYCSDKNVKPQQEPQVKKTTGIDEIKKNVTDKIKLENIPIIPVKPVVEINNGITFLNHGISEDKDFDYKQVFRINEVKSSSGKFGKFLAENGNAKEESVNGIFKAEDQLKKLQEREDKKVVLKLDNKK